MTLRDPFLCGLLVAVICGSTSLRAQCDPGNGVGGSGPDVMVGDLLTPLSYGSAGGFYAYALGTSSCNIGTDVLLWNANTNEHPVIAQNMYRLLDGRFEQIGLSWLKHGFAALTGDICGCGCVPPANGQLLGVGCSDPYGANLNGSQPTLGPRSEVIDVAAGNFIYPVVLDPVNSDLTWRRLRVHGDDLDPVSNAGALYFGEAHYISPDDAQAGNAWNNVSYRQLSVATDASRTIGYIGSTERQKPAIQAWQDQDPSVDLIDIPDGEGGLLILAVKSEDLGGGLHSYEYALYNMNSTRAVRSFTIPLPAAVTISSIGFHDVDYHSGEVFDSTDWSMVLGSGSLQWSTEEFSQNPLANALRWGTLYNFRFVANSPPIAIDATLGQFEPGMGNSLTAPAIGPSGDFTLPVTSLDCVVNGTAVDLSWTNTEPYDAIEVSRGGSVIATLLGSEVSFSDLSPIPGIQSYGVEAIDAGVPSGLVLCEVDFPFPLTITVAGTIPTVVTPSGGSSFPVEIDVSPGFSLVPGSETLWVDDGGGFIATPLIFLSGNQYDAVFPAIPCGTMFSFYLSAEANTGFVVNSPAAGAQGSLEAASAVALVDELDDLEMPGGWLLGPPNTATSGNWTYGDPVGTDEQPEDDHSPSGTQCWFTGQGAPGGATGAADVDNGETSLYSPFLDLTGLSDPTLSYWRWFSNDGGPAPSEDVFVIEISPDGFNWVEVETVGPSGAESSGDWFEHSFRVLDFISLSASTQLRFRVGDFNMGSFVEAAVDDLRLFDLNCISNDCNGNGIPDDADLVNGTSEDCNVNGVPDECDIASGFDGDCNLNGVPDFCDILLGEPDCDLDFVPDSCEIAAGGDCNSNGLLDTCEILAGNADDCDGNGEIDSCEIAAGGDCDSDGALDACQISAGTAEDCNLNGVIDSCDIASGGSLDTDLDGIPDECQLRSFIRGDTDGSGAHNIADAINMLSIIFSGTPAICDLALDANADGFINIADPITLLNYLFAGGAPLPAPFPNCGTESTPSGIGCMSFPACP